MLKICVIVPLLYIFTVFVAFRDMAKRQDAEEFGSGSGWLVGVENWG